MKNKITTLPFLVNWRSILVSTGAFSGIAAAQLLTTTKSWAQSTWQPTRSVEIIVGTDPGSGFDRTARILQKVWQTNHLVDQTVTVINKPGGYGAVGWDDMNQRGKAGNVVAINSPLLLTNNPTGNMALSYRDTTPLCILEDEEIVLAVFSGSAIQDGMA